MLKNDLISGCVMLVFGIVMLVYVIPTQTVTAGTYTISPALVPQICSMGITGLAVLLIVRSVLAMRRGAEPQSAEARPMPWLPAIAVVGIVLAAVVLFRLVHPAAATVFLVLALMLYLGERRPLALVAMPLALLAGGYLLFYKVLGLVVA